MKKNTLKKNIILIILIIITLFSFCSILFDLDTMTNSNIPKNNFKEQAKIDEFVRPYLKLSMEEQIEVGRKIWEDKNGKVNDWKIVIVERRDGEFGRNICQTKTIELQRIYAPDMLFTTLWHEMFHISQCNKLILWKNKTFREGEVVYKDYNMWKDLVGLEDWKEMAAQNETQGYLNAALEYENNRR